MPWVPAACTSYQPLILLPFGGALTVSTLTQPVSLEAMASYPEYSRGVWPEDTLDMLSPFGLGWDAVEWFPSLPERHPGPGVGGDITMQGWWSFPDMTWPQQLSPREEPLHND